MIFIIALLLALALTLLCGPALRRCSGAFYAGAAIVSGAVVALYWAAPEFLPLALRTRLPVCLGAFGTACFAVVMYAGALPNGSKLTKAIMPVRGELSIFACLVTLGHNLSFGKNYLTPGYLFSGPVTATKIAAWVSVVLILLMLVLTITSIKKVRRRFQPKKWKALQRWAYLYYGLTYVHVLLLTIPAVWKGRSGCWLTLLAYSAVFLSYALCRLGKAALVKRGRSRDCTARRQAVFAGIGCVLAVILTAAVPLSARASEAPAADEEPAVSASDEQPEPSEDVTAEMPSEEPSAESAETPSAEPSEAQEMSETPAASETPAPTAETSTAPSEKPSAAPSAQPSAAPAPTPSATPEPTPTPTPEPTAAPASKYKDGAYSGSAKGYEGTITVSVTISGDKITDISIVSYEDDDEYMDPARAVVSAILSAQSPNVSAVSGATYSSMGIMNAVNAALKKALN